MIALCWIGIGRAQSTDAIISLQQHAWFNYFGNQAISKHWGLHLEGQFRRDDFGAKWQQLLLRPGVN